MKNILFLSLFLLLLSACSSKSQPESSESQVSKQQSSQRVSDSQKPVEVAEGLDIPWSIQKNGETFYLSERPGTIAKITENQLEHQTVVFSDELISEGEAGLLGFLLDSNFSTNQEAFAYYTYSEDGEIFNKIVKLKLEDKEWREVTVLVDQLPSGHYHAGGRLAIGPNHKLYATVGDAYELSKVQETDSLNGKILRLNLDGTIPADNPFNNSYVYSYGHRNSQGLAWTTEGTLYASEHGENAHDEINQIEAGKNYGWPEIEGKETQEGMEIPLFTSGEDTWAPSGMAEWNDRLYVAALRGSAILEFDLENEKKRTLIEGYGRIRDVLIEGNTLYFVTNNLDGRGDGDADTDSLYQIQLAE